MWIVNGWRMGELRGNKRRERERERELLAARMTQHYFGRREHCQGFPLHKLSDDNLAVAHETSCRRGNSIPSVRQTAWNAACWGRETPSRPGRSTEASTMPWVVILGIWIRGDNHTAEIAEEVSNQRFCKEKSRIQTWQGYRETGSRESSKWRV